MNRRRSLSVAAAALLLLVLAPRRTIGAEPAMETKVLAGPQSAARWSCAECTMQASDAQKRGDRSVLRWHVTVDYFSGEPKYPIGWPRIGFSFKEPADRDWSGWDFLQLWIYTETSRASLPNIPAGLSVYAPDKASDYLRSLTELAKGKWVEVRVPLSLLPRQDDVRFLQLHIAEANYRHQDELDFYIDGVNLLRYAQPTLVDFAAECSVMFADLPRVPVRFDLLGIKPGQAAQVQCELRREGKVFATASAHAQRGPNRVVFDLGGAKPAVGEYELLARVAGSAGEPVAAKLRLVQSPWSAAE